MKILITGANGFLGYYLVSALLDKSYDVIATGKGECRLPFSGIKNFQYAAMDFTDPFAVHDVFELYKPSIVVHAGAMTRVDECEQEQWQAYLVNVEGTVTMLLNAEEQKSFFIFLSTDFIFDGRKGMYAEDDQPSPINFYGRTKVEAEEAVMEYEYDWAIVRTVLVYGKPMTGGANIVTVVKEKLEKGEEYKLVTDQIRTPTYIKDLANAIILVIEKKAKGIFHISGEEKLTPYDIGLSCAKILNKHSHLLKPVTAATFSQPAQRPPFTGFNIEKANRVLGYKPRSFEAGLKLSLE